MNTTLKGAKDILVKIEQEIIKLEGEGYSTELYEMCKMVCDLDEQIDACELMASYTEEPFQITIPNPALIKEIFKK